MKKIALILILMLTASSYGLVLNKPEATVLEQFFKTLCLDSEGGYVLYNAKPVCINGFYVIDSFTGAHRRHKFSVDLREGAATWKKLGFKNLCEDIIVHTYDRKDSLTTDCIHILMINKPLFIKTVKENLALFQYVLDVSITPEKLLKKLTDSQESFHSVLKEDKTLIGILLGFGTQNALYGSYSEHLQNKLLSAENPPYKNALWECESINELWKKEILINSGKKHQEFPIKTPKSNFSITSIQKEISDNVNMMTISSPKLSENLPVFIFGRLKEDSESELLISKLEKTQNEILDFLHSTNFLESVLKKILPKQKIEITGLNEATFSEQEIKKLPLLIAANILHTHQEENKDFLDGLILGMKDSDNKEPNRFLNEDYFDYEKMKIFKEIQKNIEDANLFFAELARNSNLICLIPGKIYYRIIKEGTGEELLRQSKVEINLELRTPESKLLVNTWDNKESFRPDLSDTIPGFSRGMHTMKIGEIREIYIHPSVGYGIYTTLDKGIYLLAKVELIKIIDAAGPEFGSLPEHNFDEVLNYIKKIDFKENSKIMGYERGYTIWEHYKLGNDYTLAKVLKSIEEIRFNPESIDYESSENQDLLNRLHWILYRSPEEPITSLLHSSSLR